MFYFKIKAIKTDLKCSKPTVSEFNHRLRYVALTDYHKLDIQLGGNGVVVEIDESHFAKVSQEN